jgi:hypothetical protein
VVEAPHAEVVGEVDDVLRAVDVDGRVVLLGRRDVVDGAQVEQVVDALEALPGLLGEPQPRLREIPEHRLDAVGVMPAVELAGRLLAHEHMDVALPLEQALDEMATDEARRAGDEITQCSASSGNVAEPYP